MASLPAPYTPYLSRRQRKTTSSLHSQQPPPHCTQESFVDNLLAKNISILFCFCFYFIFIEYQEKEDQAQELSLCLVWPISIKLLEHSEGQGCDLNLFSPILVICFSLDSISVQ